MLTLYRWLYIPPPASLKFPDTRKPDFRETVYDEMMGLVPAKSTDDEDDKWAGSLEAFAKDAKEKFEAGYYDDCPSRLADAKEAKQKNEQ
jgi:hypothetical protein